MKTSPRLILPGALLIVATVACAAQSGTIAAAPHLPKDPNALMELAARENGLEGTGIAPWYLHATWEISAWKNMPAMQGTFEEWWTSPQDYKAVFGGSNFHRELDVNAGHVSDAGDAQWPDPVLRLIDPLLRSPLPSPSRIPMIHFTNNNTKDNQFKIRCAAVATSSDLRPPLDGASVWFASDYCFNGNLPAIRMEIDGHFEVVFNSIVQFQGRFLPESIHVGRTGLPTLDIHVDQVHTIESKTAPIQERRP